MPPQRPLLALFLAACAALLGAALALAHPAEQHGRSSGSAQAADLAELAPPPPPLGALGHEDAAPTFRLAQRLRAAHRPILRAARRFLRAFAPYERGRLTPRLATALRSTATGEFAAELLAAPPRLPPSGPPPPATLAWLELTSLSSAAPEALLTGALRRGRSLEPFVFRFIRERGRWLAAGVGE